MISRVNLLKASENYHFPVIKVDDLSLFFGIRSGTFLCTRGSLKSEKRAGKLFTMLFTVEIQYALKERKKALCIFRPRIRKLRTRMKPIEKKGV